MFPRTAASDALACLYGCPVSDSVQPGAQRAVLAKSQRSGAADQDQEGGLEGIFGRVHVAEHLATDGEHRRSVPGQDRLERRLRGRGIRRREPLQQLAVGQADRTTGIEELVQLPLDVTRGCRHGNPPRRAGRAVAMLLSIGLLSLPAPAQFVARFFERGLVSRRKGTGRGHRHPARPGSEVDPHGHDSRPPAPATVGRGEDSRGRAGPSRPAGSRRDPRRAEKRRRYSPRPGQFGKTFLAYPVCPTATIRSIPRYPSADSLVCCLSCASCANDEGCPLVYLAFAPPGYRRTTTIRQPRPRRLCPRCCHPL